jgi:hypothetical protein
MLRNLDVRQALALVQAPTLVLHVQKIPFLSIEHGRYLAEHIKGATLVELPGGDIGLNPTQVAEVEAFLTGERPTIAASRLGKGRDHEASHRATSSTTSGSGPSGSASITTRDRTISGLLAALRNATCPPNDWPTKCERPFPLTV